MKTTSKFLFLLKAKSEIVVDCYKLKASSGFTILFAVLIGSLLFSIGLGIAHVSIREILLSAAGKESERAFFAADTGIECALFWDIYKGKQELVFPSSGNETGGREFIACNGESDVSVKPVSGIATAATSTFALDFTDGESKPAGCAFVTIGKTVSGSTVIESRGRNDCEDRINPARVERALRVRY